MSLFAIAKRELRSMFSTTMGWFILCAYLLLAGVFWYLSVYTYVENTRDLVFNPDAATGLTLARDLVAPFFGNCTIVLIMFIPALAMRLFAAETRQRTLELLLTSPVSTTEIVLGKFVGAMSFVTLMLGISAYLPLTLYWSATPELGGAFAGLLGLWLLSGAIVALGELISSLTENQVVAMVTTLSLALALHLGSWIEPDPDAWLNQLSFGAHLEDLLLGSLRLSDVVFFVVFIGFCLFATHQRVASLRWQ